ncbi:MAG TPA: cytochrome b/b6 domain-containing protein [Steroidobacteraceae bacterium]|nr:cytochrome b/b6 domain-containing protein [Steroidobacteraceae bacterium]
MSTESSDFAPGERGARAAAPAIAVDTDDARRDLAGAAVERRLVWDLPLRAFHWLFAASILASWGTAKLGFTWMQWHIRLGYWMMGLLVFRILWGLIGPRHARFTSFLKGPGAVLRYAKGLAGRGESATTVGHNPLGGIMVIIMLLLVVFQVSTGLFATDDIAYTGPFNPTVSGSTASLLTSLHSFNFNLIWAAIALHIGAITYYAFIKRQNLVPAMLHGWKPAEAVPANEAIMSSELWKALIVMIVAAIVVYGILSLAPASSPGGSLNFD